MEDITVQKKNKVLCSVRLKPELRDSIELICKKEGIKFSSFTELALSRMVKTYIVANDIGDKKT